MRVVIWCGMLRCHGGHLCIILCPGHGRDGRRGGRDCHGEKNVKYSALLNTHVSVPLALETLGPINVTGQNFLRDLGRKLTTSTVDKRETCFLLQRLSVTIQRFNSVAFRGTLDR